MTEAEEKLWYFLRDKRFEDYKFRRQQPIGDYIVDFVCFDEQLVIEVDGGQHNQQKEEDEIRTQWLEGEGFDVIRFWNNEVLNQTDQVLEELLRTLRDSPSP